VQVPEIIRMFRQIGCFLLVALYSAFVYVLPIHSGIEAEIAIFPGGNP